jgi:RsiW-degrading membrane proteinase PrsW (M82 family)
VSIAAAIAIIVPLVVLGAAVMLDRQRKQLALVVLALCWGVACTKIAGPLNGRWQDAYGFASLAVVGAPIIEELAKAAALPVLAASRRCSWFVDGAILGLASGTGFAIRENMVYLQQAPPGTDVALALARVTSTNLMHAGCTAIVGAGIAVSIGLPRWRRALIGVACLATAMSLHSTFNRLAQRTGTAAVLTVLGIAVFAVAAGIVALGSPLSRRWAASAMAARGHSAGERAMMGSSANVADLLDAFEARFGAAAAGLLDELITLQRRIGVLTHVTSRQTGLDQSTGPMDALLAEADLLRRRIGLIAMGWLRSHLPTDGGGGMWAALAEAAPASTGPSVATGLWATLADRELPSAGGAVGEDDA